MQPIVNIYEVIGANAALEAGKSMWRVHLHDACGRQTLSLEFEGAGETDDALGSAQDIVRRYFLKRAKVLEFQKMAPHIFWVKE